SQTCEFDSDGSLHWIPSSSRAVLGLTSSATTCWAPAIQSTTDSQPSNVGCRSSCRSPRSDSEAISMPASGAKASAHADDGSPRAVPDDPAGSTPLEPTGSLAPPPWLEHAASRPTRASPVRILFMTMQSPVQTLCDWKNP